MRYLGLSPWRRAPLRALSIASLSAGVAIAAFVLGLAAASRPMFVSSAASGSLAGDIEDGCRFSTGLTLERNAAFGPPSEDAPTVVGYDVADAAIADAVRGIDDVDRLVTVFGPLVRAENPANEAAPLQMRMLSRTGFEDHLEVIDRGDQPGVWVPSNISAELDLHGGDEITVHVGSQPVTLPIAGTFRDLSVERDSSWCSLGTVLQEPRQGGAPPPVLLMDQDLLVDTFTGSGGSNLYVRWEYAPPESGWTLGEATSTVNALRGVAEASDNAADPLNQLLGRGESRIDSISTVDHARRTSATVSSAAGPIAFATAGVALLVLLTAARSWLDRRRREVTVLALRGAGPTALAIKALLELAIPVLVGAVGGVVASVALVRAIGPSTSIESDAIRSGVLQVGIALVIAAVAAAAVVAAAVRRVSVDADGAAPRQRLLWWEPPVLLLAAGALYELRHRGGAVVGGTEVDSLALLFPFLLLAGGGGLLARLALSRRTLGSITPHLPTAGWLTARRLAARRLRAIAVVTSASVAVGIVVFAASMSASIRSTAEAKALLGPGAVQVVRVGLRDVPPPGIGDDGHTTVVTRLSETGVLVRGHANADVLGVDPTTFADGAYWDDSFADTSLPSLLDRLDVPAAGEPIPAIAVGDGLLDDMVLTVPRDDGGDAEVTVRVVGRATAFPGLGFRQDRPLVVMDRQALAEAGVTRSTEIWSDRLAPDLLQRLHDAGQSPVFVITAGESATDSTLRAQLWSVDYLEFIGLAAALVTLAGLGLYFAASLARHRLGSAVAHRLGMKRRTAALATGLEIGGMVVAGWLFGGALSWLAARLVYTSFDVRPNTSPRALFRFGWEAVLWTGLAALAISVIAAVVIEWGTSRRSMQRMIRDAE